MLGAALLWFGWFGFNVGAAATPEQAGLILINTMGAPATAMLGWLLVERIRDGHPTSLGAASGAVAGLVAITPACADVSPFWAMVLGLVAGMCSAVAVALKYRMGMDDSLDVIGVHLVSGVVGTVALGFIAIPSGESAGGLLYGGGLALLGTQVIATVVSVIYCSVVTLVIALVIRAFVGLRITAEAEIEGIDITEHAESGYNLAGDASGSFRPRRPVPGSLEDVIERQKKEQRA
jgi:Amt family ammonium transporter